MAKNLVVHAGTAKTGTTTLQSWATKFRQSLIHQQLHYPDLFQDKEKYPSSFRSAHHILAATYAHLWRNIEQYDLEFAWSTLENVCGTDIENVLISSEVFYPAIISGNGGFLKRLSQASFGRNIKVVLYIRDHPEFLKSAAFEQARHGVPIFSFSDYVLNPKPNISKAVAYKKNIKIILDNPYVSECIVRPFRPDAWEGGNIISDFCTYAGFEVDDVPHESNSMNVYADTVAMQRLITQTYISGLSRTRQNVQALCYKFAKNLDDSSEKFNWSVPIYKAIREFFKADRDFLDHIYGAETFPERLPPPNGDGSAANEISRRVYQEITNEEAPLNWTYIDAMEALRFYEAKNFE